MCTQTKSQKNSMTANDCLNMKCSCKSTNVQDPCHIIYECDFYKECVDEVLDEGVSTLTRECPSILPKWRLLSREEKINHTLHGMRKLTCNMGEGISEKCHRRIMPKWRPVYHQINKTLHMLN